MFSLFSQLIQDSPSCLTLAQKIFIYYLLFLFLVFFKHHKNWGKNKTRHNASHAEYLSSAIWHCLLCSRKCTAICLTAEVVAACSGMEGESTATILASISVPLFGATLVHCAQPLHLLNSPPHRDWIWFSQTQIRQANITRSDRMRLANTTVKR